MSQKVKFLSKENCGQCFGAKMFLNASGIPFEEIKGEEAHNKVVELGFGGFPVIIPPEGLGSPFQGNQTVRLKELKEAMGL